MLELFHLPMTTPNDVRQQIVHDDVKYWIYYVEIFLLLYDVRHTTLINIPNVSCQIFCRR